MCVLPFPTFRCALITVGTIERNHFSHHCQRVLGGDYTEGYNAFGLCRLGSNESAPDGDHDGVGAVIDFQFLHQVPQMHFHGVFTDR